MRRKLNVEYILLAEFDIITGSTVKRQYPFSIGVDEQMLAELMLPDGAHKREDDWTVFFLNRPGFVGKIGDSTRLPPEVAKKASRYNQPFAFVGVFGPNEAHFAPF